MRNQDRYEVLQAAKTKEEAIEQSMFQVGMPAIISDVKVHSNTQGWIIVPEFSLTENIPPPKPVFNSASITRAVRGNGKAH